jgi:uncharacterized protein
MGDLLPIIPAAIWDREGHMISAAKYGPWAVVTGGSEGIGASFAKKLAQAGINLVLVARRQGPLEQTADKLRKESGVQVRTLPLDLTRGDVLDHVRKATSDIDVGLLVHNAADTGHIAPFLDQTLDEAMGSIRLIALAGAALAHHFAGPMAKRGRGGLLLVGSLTGAAGMANVATYGGAKAFIQIFGEALWTELNPRGIDVMVQIVGSTDTPARARSGSPNVSGMTLANPDDVAAEGLANLTNGPVYVMPAYTNMFQHLCASPRGQLTGRSVQQGTRKD